MAPILGLLLSAALAPPQTPLCITAEVRGSLDATLVDATPHDGAALAAQAARLLRWRADAVRNIHPRDHLALLYVYETTLSNGQSETSPELVALRYEGLEANLRAYRFSGHDDVPRYFDEAGVLVEPWLLRSPVAPYIQITERVQRGRGKRRHDGLDLKAAVGTPVRVPWPARVSRVNWHVRFNGMCVEVVYSSGYTARFLHLSEVTKGLKPGQQLAANTRIGAVGSSGRSGAPHLHYAILGRDDRPRDPLAVHGTERLTLRSHARAAFDVVRSSYDELFAGHCGAHGSGQPRAAAGSSTGAVCVEAEEPLSCEP